jgi:uroporphyrinogen decarboxylase
METHITTDLHRQRFQACLDHREADRIPLTLGGPSCSLHRACYARLVDYLGLPCSGEAAPIIDNILQIVEPDMQMLQRFDIDVVWLLPREAPVAWSPGGETYLDEFGRTFSAGGGFFNQSGYPLQQGTLEELRGYRFPTLTGDRVAGLGEKALRLYGSGYGLGIDGPWGVYEICSSLHGTAEYLMDLALNPEYAEELAERVLVEYHIPYYTLLLEEAGAYAQMVMISDDLGSQQRLIFSPRTFRKIFKPRLKRLIEHIHSLADVRVYMHSDGAVYDLIPDLIEIGVEGLNPVQYNAQGMEVERLKREFGGSLGFFGGTVENELLSFHNPAEISRVVAANVKTLASGGGFLFAPIHNISQEVPPENVVALMQAGLDFGRYGQAGVVE